MHTNQIHLDYPRSTMFQMVEKISREYPGESAYEFYQKKTSYRSFVRQIEQAAASFIALGLKRDDVVTICMPNCPQALVCFYALNRVGIVSNMVHPQSAQNEISYYLSFSSSKAILTLDMFYEKVLKSLENVPQDVIILTARMQDELPLHLAGLYIAKAGRNYLSYPSRPKDLLWKRFIRMGKNVTLTDPCYEDDHTAVILYSGGTSGSPKGICLTDMNFNALALQAVSAIKQDFHAGLRMLSCMPLFHGFGLGINLHTVLIHGACCILMPTFNGKTYARMLIKRKPNFIAGVPTIFDALLHIPELNDADLSFLMGMFCGGDSLSVELKKKIDHFLKEHNAHIQVREGYGLTECVTASCLTPKDTYREGSIGLPFPDTYYCIVKPGTDDVLPPGEEGEIILRGPSVMKGYLKNPEETDLALRRLADGNIWLYTGDLGMMDEDGFVYFRQRIKRVIITNGYNVYPSQIENVIDGCPEVSYSCVIGVKDPRRMQRVRAYVVLKEGCPATEETRQAILDQISLHIASYALPKEIIFREELPKTLVGKVAYRLLEEEAMKESEN